MICKSCARAAADGVQGEKGHKEYGCDGKCPCMHRVGTPAALFNMDRLTEEAKRELLGGSSSTRRVQLTDSGDYVVTGSSPPLSEFVHNSPDCEQPTAGSANGEVP